MAWQVRLRSPSWSFPLLRVLSGQLLTCWFSVSPAWLLASFSFTRSVLSTGYLLRRCTGSRNKSDISTWSRNEFSPNIYDRVAVFPTSRKVAYFSTHNHGFPIRDCAVNVFHSQIHFQQW